MTMFENQLSKLASSEVQDYIFAHTNADEKKLLLKLRSILGIPTAVIAQQIAARRKAETKLPVFFETKGLVYPPAVNLEQSSSQATAMFKAEIIQKESSVGKPTVVDLTGGFGIDSFFYSDRASAVDYVEPNDELVQIVRHNFHLLKKENISFHAMTAEDFLEKNSGRYDFIYLDPSRRDSRARKVFALNDCTPNVCQLLPRLLSLTDHVLLKASPLLDIKQGLKELEAVKKVIVVSVDNECKELLFVIEKNFAKEPAVQTCNLNYEGKIKDSFDFAISEEEKTISQFGPPQKYLYEPNASIMKAGAFKLVGERFGLRKMHVNTHLYTSIALKADFPGRVFEIDQGITLTSLAGKHANIICRNYPLKPDDLKKKLKTKDGGEKYVIAFSGLHKKYVTIANRLA